MDQHIEQQEELRTKRRTKKKHPTMRVSGTGTKKLALRLTRKA